MNSSVEENYKRRSVIARLKELTSFFGKIKKESGTTSTQHADELASKLFARAPLAFLESTPTEELASIANQAQALIEEFSKKPSPIIQRAINGRGFFIVVTNGSFIVSSIAEALRQNSIDIELFLHPIITFSSAEISLSYIEVSDDTAASFTQIAQIITDTIESLTAVTSAHLAMRETIATVEQHAGTPAFLKSFAASDNQEVKQFFHWLLEDTFIIVGTAYWSVDNGTLNPTATNKKGAFTLSSLLGNTIITECTADVRQFTEFNEPLWISKLSVRSPVLRSLPLTHIYVAHVDEHGVLNGVTSIVGIFSSKGLNVDATEIPLIHTKVQRLIRDSYAMRGSHDYKVIIDTVDRMPKEEAIRLTVGSLQEIIDQTIDVYTRNDASTTIRYDASGRGAMVLVMMPRSWFSETTALTIKRAIETFFAIPLDSTEDYLDLSAHRLARIYYHIPFLTQAQSAEASALQEQIKNIAKDWSAKFIAAWKEEGLDTTKQDPSKIASLFTETYRATYSAEQALIDLDVCNTLNEAKPIRVYLGEEGDGTAQTNRIDIYALNKTLTLSSLIPVLEHAGFSVISDTSAEMIAPSQGKISIYRFTLKPQTQVALDRARFNDCLGPGLEEILMGNAEDDVLTSLMLTAHLNLRCIILLRAYTAHLWQLNIFPRKHLLREALATNPQVALKLWEVFEYKFNPARAWSKEERLSRFAKSKEEYEDLLRAEKDIVKDRILRSLLDLVEHTVRTNFFLNPPAIAVKVNSRAVDFIPEPKPWMEVFIHSKDLEGCHLRSGPISRGGIRWSERPDDFRTEVLGLVKTQKVKNVFIVPEGAKGGFIVRNPPANPAEMPAAVTECYKLYARTLLTLADNRTTNTEIKPALDIYYDDLDPYFVVAADKGTATFSDIANNIASEEFQFWLDDAFASGGSNGYDHKLYGITAKGAWECVLRHFNDIGLNYLEQPFTVVGIGDMAGDVFGNGLILSDKIKLIAAFNHQHIFLDPNPDPARSFEERLRLFNTPRTRWSDYNPALISDGGGVFERASKEIRITPQVRGALQLDSSVKDVLSSEELINHILKAQVDLLWNGGIGTYVKASTESNAQVNDSSNDRLRVSATELRCKIVGEGGNLGFTQKARIEFSALGGRINTDAIDNSGGVGLSDNEVNIKILFSGLLQSGRVTREARNVLLKQMASEVCEKVLQHNRDHAYRLTVSSERTFIQHEYFKVFMSNLARLGFINRELDSLPQDDELYTRLSTQKGLYRPELATCIAGSKMWVKSLLSTSKLIEDPLFNDLLLDYFPTELQKQFPKEILAHPLRNAIITTQATNRLVNTFGISFLYRSMLEFNLPAEVVLKAALATLIVCNTHHHILKIQKLDVPKTAELYIRLRSVFEHGLRTCASWIMTQSGTSLTLKDTIDIFRRRLSAAIDGGVYDQKLAQESAANGLPEDTARMIAVAPYMNQIMEAANLADIAQVDFNLGWMLYKHSAEKLKMYELREFVRNLKPQNRWEMALRKASVRDIEQGLSRIVLKAIQNGIRNSEGFDAFLAASTSYGSIVQSVNELTNISFGLSHLALIARQVREFSV